MSAAASQCGVKRKGGSDTVDNGKPKKAAQRYEPEPATFGDVLEVVNTDKNYAIRVKVFESSQIDAHTEGGRIMVSGSNKKKIETTNTTITCSFTSTHKLPPGELLHNLHGNLENGILTISGEKQMTKSIIPIKKI